MIAKRKICINAQERSMAMSYNQGMANEGAFGRSIVPDPIFAEVSYSFRMDNVMSWWIDNRDIICNILYDGIIIFEYDAALEAMLHSKFSFC